MAEFCLDHLNELLDENLSPKDAVLDMDLCESCGEIKPCVMYIKKRYFVKQFFKNLFKRIH